jgi:DNA-binding NarL/FixJ family response regulator
MGAVKDRVRIVVADDDEGLRGILVGLLDDLGYQVEGAFGDAGAAIARCVSDTPDLVVFDQRMPGMSGLEAARTLQGLLPELPVILLSAYDDAGLQSAATAAGVSAYLVKGCSAADIVAAVDRATEPQTVDRAAEPQA